MRKPKSKKVTFEGKKMSKSKMFTIVQRRRWGLDKVEKSMEFDFDGFKVSVPESKIKELVKESLSYSVN